MAGYHFYIGISGRTNADGASQIIDILNKYGMSGSTIQLTYGLHLKSSLAHLGDNLLVVSGDLMLHHELEKFEVIEVPEEESYAANCVRINDRVLMPAGFPATKERIHSAGYDVIETDVSEFRKLDGGVSCLSLRF
jgi:dimethylargininase